MRPRITAEFHSRSPMFLPMLVLLIYSSACTFYGEHPARSLSEATGGEALERVFWQNIQGGKWVEVERALASNYTGITPTGRLDRSSTMDQYRQWQLKDFTLGDLQTELNGITLVVTYNITVNGTTNGPGGSQSLPSGALHMMTVWQQQKAGWVAIAHSVSQPQ
jgi:hypothetical protein